MSYVRFATVCDKRGQRGPEYLAHTIPCSECGDDVCQVCAESYDPDLPGHALCRECYVEMVS